jgi:2-C-methyl-D-erythritol 4-phosphate cytidylyltransferase
VPSAPRAALVVLAGGDGRRVGQDTNKVLLPLAGRRVFTWSIRWARELPHVTHTVLVIRERDREVVERTIERELDGPEVTVVVGGDSRHGSEWSALQALAEPIERGEIDVVVIHDAARPLASTRLFEDVVTAAATHGGALPVLAPAGLITLATHDEAATEDVAAVTQGAVVAVQTPQAFAAAPLLAAYRAADRDGFVGTDTASCIERYADLPIACVPSDARNLKITFPEDLFLAERLLAKAGYDLSDRRAAAGHHSPLDWLRHARPPRQPASRPANQPERQEDPA